MVDKTKWPRPAAWAITQNEKLWTEFDSVADPSVIIGWSLGDSYRTSMMRPGDRALFWMTGPSGGIARIGFVLSTEKTPKGRWVASDGKRHKAPYSGEFFMPPLPNRRYIHRSALLADPRLQDCELLSTASQQPGPLRIEAKEWKSIEKLLRRFDQTSAEFRSSWPQR